MALGKPTDWSLRPALGRSGGSGHSGLSGCQVLPALLHVIELLADLGQARFQLVHRVVQRLDLSRNLFHAAVGVAGLALHLLLQVVNCRVHLVDAVGALLDEVFHRAHVHVDGLLHAGHLVLQRLNLGLQLDHVFVRASRRSGGCQHQRRDCQPSHIVPKSHSRVLLLSLLC